MVIQTNNINNNIDNNNNSNNNNNNNSSNDVIIKSIKNGKSKYVLLLPDLSQKRMGLLKRKKKCFPFLNYNKNGKSMFPNCIERLGHEKKRNKTTTNKQRKTKEKINK